MHTGAEGECADRSISVDGVVNVDGQRHGQHVAETADKDKHQSSQASHQHRLQPRPNQPAQTRANLASSLLNWPKQVHNK